MANPDDRFTRESERLRSVYKSYRDPAHQRRWTLEHPTNRLMRAEAAARLKETLDREGIAPQDATVLDIGCGSGGSTIHWVDAGVCLESITGADILLERLVLAPDEMQEHLVCAEGHRLPFKSASFDVVSVFTVFSSVLNRSIQDAIARQMERVLAPSGRIICYDLRLPNPLNRQIRPVTLSRLHELFPDARIRSTTLTVLPPLSRRVAKTTEVYQRLSKRRALHSHRLTVIEPTLHQ